MSDIRALSLSQAATGAPASGGCSSCGCVFGMFAAALVIPETHS